MKLAKKNLFDRLPGCKNISWSTYYSMSNAQLNNSSMLEHSWERIHETLWLRFFNNTSNIALPRKDLPWAIPLILSARRSTYVTRHTVYTKSMAPMHFQAPETFDWSLNGSRIDLGLHRGGRGGVSLTNVMGKRSSSSQLTMLFAEWVIGHAKIY